MNPSEASHSRSQPNPGHVETPVLDRTKSAKVFCETKEIREILRRGSTYLAAGVAIHLSGPSGIGKTALAVRMAAKLDQPLTMITGHNDLSSSDFIGREVGHSETTVVDKYIQSVSRKQKNTAVNWRDSKLAEAMQHGHTLIYDEFTRASPKANVVFLSVIEEGLMVSGNSSNANSYIRAHPDFRIILTSNPADYVAVNASSDALLDRLVTLNLNGYSSETEAKILHQSTGISVDLADRIVKVVRLVRDGTESKDAPSMRSSLLIARIVAHVTRSAPLSEADFASIATDVMLGRAPELDELKVVNAVRATVVPKATFSQGTTQ